MLRDSDIRKTFEYVVSKLKRKHIKTQEQKMQQLNNFTGAWNQSTFCRSTSCLYLSRFRVYVRVYVVETYIYH